MLPAAASDGSTRCTLFARLTNFGAVQVDVEYVHIHLHIQLPFPSLVLNPVGNATSEEISFRVSLGCSTRILGSCPSFEMMCTSEQDVCGSAQNLEPSCLVHLETHDEVLPGANPAAF